MRTGFPILYSVFNKIRRDLHLAVLRWTRDSNDPEAVFDYFFEHNLFGDAESLSGTGSSMRATATIRDVLPALMRELDVHDVLDIPCGDFHWAKEIDWAPYAYIGADVVPGLIELNQKKYTGDGHTFVVLDILKDDLPRSDLVLCRDLFIHFSHADVLVALANIKRSGAGYLLTTHYTGVTANRDIKLGSFRPLNLERSPFNLPPPVRSVADDDYLKLWGRTLALWSVASLP